MRILVTNDDGIFATGIQVLAQQLANCGEVYVVAPDQERSATGHSITVHHPLRVKEVVFSGVHKAWSVDGTPADCVKLGVEALVPGKPDLVVSGINQGANLGTDVLYSGTVSAAIEGVINGVPSVAVSLTDYEANNFEVAAKFVEQLIKSGHLQSLTIDTLLNINVPNLSAAELKGIKVAKLGERRYKNLFEERKDPRGRSYYWMGGEAWDNLQDSEADVTAIHQGYIAVTPIHFDLTNYRILNEVKNWNLQFKR